MIGEGLKNLILKPRAAFLGRQTFDSGGTGLPCRRLFRDCALIALISRNRGAGGRFGSSSPETLIRRCSFASWAFHSRTTACGRHVRGAIHGSVGATYQRTRRPRQGHPRLQGRTGRQKWHRVNVLLHDGSFAIAAIRRSRRQTRSAARAAVRLHCFSGKPCPGPATRRAQRCLRK
jgi:hypothetical protein